METKHVQSEAAAQARLEIALAVAMHIYQDTRRGMLLYFVCLVNVIKLLERVLFQMPRRMLTQASTIFEDAHGYVFHINTQFVQSWRVRDGLAINFKYANLRTRPLISFWKTISKRNLAY